MYAIKFLENNCMAWFVIKLSLFKHIISEIIISF